jgi:hypothetical protein
VHVLKHAAGAAEPPGSGNDGNATAVVAAGEDAAEAAALAAISRVPFGSGNAVTSVMLGGYRYPVKAGEYSPASPVLAQLYVVLREQYYCVTAALSDDARAVGLFMTPSAGGAGRGSELSTEGLFANQTFVVEDCTDRERLLRFGGCLASEPPAAMLAAAGAGGAGAALPGMCGLRILAVGPAGGPSSAAFTAGSSRKCLDLARGELAEKAPVLLWDCADHWNQKWHFDDLCRYAMRVRGCTAGKPAAWRCALTRLAVFVPANKLVCLEASAPVRWGCWLAERMQV